MSQWLNKPVTSKSFDFPQIAVWQNMSNFLGAMNLSMTGIFRYESSIPILLVQKSTTEYRVRSLLLAFKAKLLQSIGVRKY